MPLRDICLFLLCHIALDSAPGNLSLATSCRGRHLCRAVHVMAHPRCFLPSYARYGVQNCHSVACWANQPSYARYGYSACHIVRRRASAPSVLSYYAESDICRLLYAISGKKDTDSVSTRVQCPPVRIDEVCDTLEQRQRARAFHLPTRQRGTT